MSNFVHRDVVFTTTEGGRYSTKEHAEDVQFHHDIAFWFSRNPIDREMEIQPDPVRFRQWLHGHRKTIAMILERFEDATPII